jgi:hypothetical protein
MWRDSPPAGDARCHEEMLRQVAALADSLDYEGIKAHVLAAVQVRAPEGT